MWLSYGNKDAPRWKSQTNSWSLRSIIQAWQRGYRKFRITWKPFDLQEVN